MGPKKIRIEEKCAMSSLDSCCLLLCANVLLLLLLVCACKLYEFCIQPEMKARFSFSSAHSTNKQTNKKLNKKQKKNGKIPALIAHGKLEWKLDKCKNGHKQLSKANQIFGHTTPSIVACCRGGREEKRRRNEGDSRVHHVDKPAKKWKTNT